MKFENSPDVVGEFAVEDQRHEITNVEFLQTRLIEPNALWSITAKNTDCSTGPLTRPFVQKKTQTK